MSAPGLRRVWLVQDRRTGLFLCPVDGWVGYTKWVKEAGGFDSVEQAVEASGEFCEGADIVSFYVNGEADGASW